MFVLQTLTSGTEQAVVAPRDLSKPEIVSLSIGAAAVGCRGAFTGPRLLQLLNAKVTVILEPSKPVILLPAFDTPSQFRRL